MKTFKNKFFKLLSPLFLLVLCLISFNAINFSSFNAFADETGIDNQGVGTLIDNNKQNTYFNFTSLINSYSLYQNSAVEEIEKTSGVQVLGDKNKGANNYFTTSLIMNGATGKKYFNNDNLKLTSSFSDNGPRIATVFSISDNLRNAFNNGYLTITISANLETEKSFGGSWTKKYNDTAYMSLYTGDINTSNLGDLTNKKYLNEVNDGKTGKSTQTLTLSKQLGHSLIDGNVLLTFTTRSNANSHVCALIVSNLTITITSTDKTRPDISNIKIDGVPYSSYTNPWTKTNKTLTFDVLDTESGVNEVKINNSDADIGIVKTKNAYGQEILHCTYSKITSAEITDFVLTATDNVGNSFTSETLKLGKVDSKGIDENASVEAKCDVALDNIPIFHTKNTSFVISFIKDIDIHSKDKIFYTFDGTKPDSNNQNQEFDYSLNSNKFKDGSGNIIENKYLLSKSFEYNGTYTLNLLFVDEAGNKKELSYTFKVNDKKYYIDVNYNENEFSSLNILNIKTDEIGDYVHYGAPLKINFITNTNYKHRDLLVNGNSKTVRTEIVNNVENNEYICDWMDISDEINIVLLNRFIVKIDEEETIKEYTFCEANIDLIYYLNTEKELGISTQALKDKIQISCIPEGYSTATDIYDAGKYTVSWQIAENDTDYVGSGSFEIEVLKKGLTIVFKDLNNFVYNGSEQALVAGTHYDNLEGHEINASYYLIEDTNKTNPLSSMLDAGEYLVVFNLVNTGDNYKINNNEIEVLLSQKEITANVFETTFKFNGEVQSIDYSLFDMNNDITASFDHRIEYNNDPNVNFKNAGVYSYKIIATDSKNYNILNATGTCTINTINAKISVEKDRYDYTGSLISLKYSISEVAENGEIIEDNINVLGLKLSFDINGEKVDLLQPNKENEHYNFLFSLSEDNKNNYVLSGDLSGEVRVIKTKIIVNFTNTYEYSGENIDFKYFLFNEYNEPIENLSNVKVVFKNNSNEALDSISEVGDYTFELAIVDTSENSPKHEFVYNSHEVKIVNANLSVDFNNKNLEYDKNGISLNYKISSQFEKDFTNNEFVSVKVLDSLGKEIKANNGKYAFEKIGKYSCVFYSNSDYIVLNTTIEFNIIKKKVSLNVETDYTFNGLSQNFVFNVNEDKDEVIKSVTLTYLKEEGQNEAVTAFYNAGKYSYEIVLNENYEFVYENEVNISSGEIVVKPKELTIVNLDSLKSGFTYSGEAIEFNVELSENVDFSISISYQETNLSEIINAGSYKINIETNNNYKVKNNNFSLEVNKLEIEILLSNLSQIYNKQNKVIDVKFQKKDGTIINEIEDEQISVTYYALNEQGQFILDEDGQKISTLDTSLANTYYFEVTLNHVNFSASKSGELVVSPKEVTLNVLPNQSKIYLDNDLESFDYTIDGVIEGDELGIILERDKEKENFEAVGAYKILLKKYTNQNYIVNYDNSAVFNILKRRIMIVPQNKTVIYGEEDYNFSYTTFFDDLKGEGLNISFEVSGELNKDNLRDAGSYDISLSKDTLSNKNYDISFKKAQYIVNKKQVDIKINNIEVVYGTNMETNLTFTCDEVKLSDCSGSLQREEGNDVGEYKITLGDLENKNYSFNISNELGYGIYKITKKDAFITITNNEKVYGNDDNITFDCTGIIDGDVVKGSLYREDQTNQNVGSYKILLDDLESQNPNYNFILKNQGSDVFTIKQKGITLNISNISQVYGEEEKALTYEIIGLEYDDEIILDLSRRAGEDVGVYDIFYKVEEYTNYYVVNYPSAVYEITKANITLSLQDNVSVEFSGKDKPFTYTDFPFELKYTYKLNGIKVECANLAGEYIVFAEFEGNKNYNPSKSQEVTYIVRPKIVCFSLGNNSFVYDGQVKNPIFYFDENSGLSKNSISISFENDTTPIDVGEYNFSIEVIDNNFEGSISGSLIITNAFSVVTDNAIIESDEPIFDSKLQNLRLVMQSFGNKFNNQQVLQACAFENVDKLENNHIYTVRLKANSDDKNVYVYKLDKNNCATELVVSLEDGYYVFKVDGLDCSYIITKDIEPMSIITFAIIIVVSILVLISLIIAFRIRKVRRRKRALANAKNVDTNKILEEVSNLKQNDIKKLKEKKEKTKAKKNNLSLENNKNSKSQSQNDSFEENKNN